MYHTYHLKRAPTYHLNGLPWYKHQDLNLRLIDETMSTYTLPTNGNELTTRSLLPQGSYIRRHSIRIDCRHLSIIDQSLLLFLSIRLPGPLSSTTSCDLEPWVTEGSLMLPTSQYSYYFFCKWQIYQRDIRLAMRQGTECWPVKKPPPSSISVAGITNQYIEVDVCYD